MRTLGALLLGSALLGGLLLGSPRPAMETCAGRTQSTDPTALCYQPTPRPYDGPAVAAALDATVSSGLRCQSVARAHQVPTVAVLVSQTTGEPRVEPFDTAWTLAKAGGWDVLALCYGGQPV